MVSIMLAFTKKFSPGSSKDRANELIQVSTTYHLRLKSSKDENSVSEEEKSCHMNLSLLFNEAE